MRIIDRTDHVSILIYKGTRLGIAVKPEDVRLIITIDDPYS